MRSSGVLLPVFSLPGKYGIGALSKEAYAFVDFLKSAGQKYWQILPIGPTSYGDSPYQTFSSFAGNPYFIDLDTLIKEKLISVKDLKGVDFGRKDTDIDYGKLYNARYAVLRKAFKNSHIADNPKFRDFLKDNENWIDDYALFMALKDAFDGKSFYEWPDELKKRDEKALSVAKEQYAEDVLFYEFLQYEFEKQWLALKKYANDKDIEIIGDIPIYVAADSADVWANPKLFDLDKDCMPIHIAGCPPDAFAVDGQRWGNPVYTWSYHKKTGYQWWIDRMTRCISLYDVIRIDHFRGFDEYYSIDSSEETARNGKWVKGPGYSLFGALKKAIPDMKVIAEDLGFITDTVRQLINKTGFPNMKIVEFGFDGRKLNSKKALEAVPNEYLTCNFPNTNCVVYTGTHDNETVKGWLKNMKKAQLDEFKAYAGTSSNDYDILTDKAIDLALSSVAEMAIIPMQDYLHLGNEARINTPSTTGENWRWRMKAGVCTKELAKSIKEKTVLFCRYQ